MEVHEHCIIRGPRSNRTGAWPNGMGSSFFHSHEGGDVPHGHPDTGPACYTIDKDEWARKTRMVGGGRKKFTAKPIGEQFEIVPREPPSFDVFILDSAQHASRVDGKLHTEAECDGKCGDPMFGTAERMKLAYGMTARVHDLRTARRLP